MLKIIFLLMILFHNLISNEKLEAMLVERVVNFVTWPNLENNFTICTYKNSPLELAMEKEYKNKTMQDKHIVVRNITSSSSFDPTNCQVIYFTQELNQDIHAILQKIKNKPIFTITNTSDDVYEFMMFGIYYENQKVRFIINLNNIHDLNVNYRILNLSRQVAKK